MPLPLTWLYAVGATIVVSAISLVGLLFISRDEQKLRRRVSLLVSLAVGALFGSAFIHLLPESAEAGLTLEKAGLLVTGAVFAFFILDKYLHWHYHGDEHGIAPTAYKVLFADGLHNFLDGIAIGAAFLVSAEIGLAATVAVILHEIPQEIGDFGILIRSGFSKAKALTFNFLSAATAVLGAVLALIVGNAAEAVMPVILALTAGMFIYIAGTDLIPELHRESPRRSFGQVLALALGILLMIFI